MGGGSKPTVGVMADLWPSESEPHNAPYVRELVVRLAGRTRQVVLVPKLLFPRAHRRIWGDAVQGWQRGHSTPSGDIRVLRYPMFRVPKGTEIGARAAGSRLTLRLHGERPRLVHGHFVYAVGPACVRLAQTLRVPALLTAHGTDVRWLGDLRGELQKRHHDEMVAACLQADAITVVARWMVSHLLDVGVAEERISIVPMGIDETVFRPYPRAAARAALGLDSAERIVLFVGRATPEKGADVLRGALTMLAGEAPSVRGYVAGPFPLEGSTHVGMLEPSQLALWMAAADLVCLPSFSEGMPVAVSEALASGTPVVASAVGGIVEQIRPGTNGELVPAGDPEALRHAILVALGRDWDQLEIRATSEPFWWSVVAQRFEEQYERLLGSLSPSAS